MFLMFPLLLVHFPPFKRFPPPHMLASLALVHVPVKLSQSQRQPLTQVSDSLEIGHVLQRGCSLTRSTIQDHFKTQDDLNVKKSKLCLHLCPCF